MYGIGPQKGIFWFKHTNIDHLFYKFYNLSMDLCIPLEFIYIKNNPKEFKVLAHSFMIEDPKRELDKLERMRIRILDSRINNIALQYIRGFNGKEERS